MKLNKELGSESAAKVRGCNMALMFWTVGIESIGFVKMAFSLVTTNRAGVT